MKDQSNKPEGNGRGGYLSMRLKGLLNVGVGNIFASTVIAGFLLGLLVDRWLSTAPIFMLAFGLLGLVGGMLRVHRLMSRQDEQDKR